MLIILRMIDAGQTPDISPGPSCIWMTKGIGCVNANLLAAILSSADLSTKLSAMCVSRGFREVLQYSSAWNPLVIDQAECRGLLKSLRASYFSRDFSRPKWQMPHAFNQVSAIDVHLVDMERSVLDPSDTEDDQEQRPIPMAIVSPMREFGRGWVFRQQSQCTRDVVWMWSCLKGQHGVKKIWQIVCRLAFFREGVGADYSEHWFLFNGLWLRSFSMHQTGVLWFCKDPVQWEQKLQSGSCTARAPDGGLLNRGPNELCKNTCHDSTSKHDNFRTWSSFLAGTSNSLQERQQHLFYSWREHIQLPCDSQAIQASVGLFERALSNQFQVAPGKIRR